MTPKHEPQPARGYSWPPFEDGNTAALTHGTYSPVMVAARALELRPMVTTAAPWTAAPEFAGTLELYCRTLATALLGLEHIAKVAEEKGYGAVPNRLVESVNAMTNTAIRAGTKLGLDPKAKATIMALSASTETSLAGLEQLTERGRLIRERRDAALKATEPERTDDETDR